VTGLSFGAIADWARSLVGPRTRIGRVSPFAWRERAVRNLNFHTKGLFHLPPIPTLKLSETLCIAARTGRMHGQMQRVLGPIRGTP
jgi:hypothetical protein